MTDSASRIAGLFVELFELSAETVTPSARLHEDLDLDSLDGVDLVVAIEKSFAIRVEDKVVHGLRTVGEIQSYVAELVASSSS